MIQTTEQLISKIADEMVWRRKELSDLRALVQEFDGQLRSRVLIRSAVALLYAHWEGFVKKTAGYYLEFVSSHRLTYGSLASNFVGLSLRAKFQDLSASNKISAGNALAEFFCTALDKQSNVPYKNVVDTKSNLTSKVLLDILASLGLDADGFSTRLHFIDSSLVSPRNFIAHGEMLSLSVPDYILLHDDVIALLEIFRNEVENASVLKRFERVVA